MIYIVRGLLYGDEGKGSIVDYLSKSNCSYVVKEGGPQAAHHVVTMKGIKRITHRSEQMSSAVFNPGVGTFCSKNMFVHPQNLIMENTMLHVAGVHDGMERMCIDSRCPIVTPFNKMIGNLREVARGKQKHGSTGLGVGDAASDFNENISLTIADLDDNKILKEKIDSLMLRKYDEAEQILADNPDNNELKRHYKYYLDSLFSSGYTYITSMLNSYKSFAELYSSCIVDGGDEFMRNILDTEENVIFEGSQGALLDPVYGFKPYVTKTRTTFDSALELIGNRYKNDIRKIGVIRAYTTRHGAGPFVTQNDFLTRTIPDRFNSYNMWQGHFRIGWLDLVALKYALGFSDVNSIALTNLDRLSGLKNIFICTGYLYKGDDMQTLDEFFEWKRVNWCEPRIAITKFKNTKQKPNYRIRETNEKLANLLFDCVAAYTMFEGWDAPIEDVKRISKLPSEAKRYIEYIEEKLNKPISIISVGETSENKIMN